jgi:hypothetical protein
MNTSLRSDTPDPGGRYLMPRARVLFMAKLSGEAYRNEPRYSRNGLHPRIRFRVL